MAGSYMDVDLIDGQKYKLTFTMSDGSTIDAGEFVAPYGPQGEKGDKGDTGATPNVSATATVDNAVGTPTVTVTKGGTTANPTLTFAFENLKGEQGIQGIQGTQGPQGPKGDTGSAFSISKVYASVDAMNAGYATDGVPVGGFVIIDTGNVDDADNAKLYVKGASAYTYLTDLSGAQGMQGPKGDTGATPNITMSASVDANVGTPSVAVTKGGTTDNPTFKFSFANIKGERGQQGVQGASVVSATIKALEV